MSSNITKKAKGFIISPVESFQQSRGDELSDAIRYFLVALAVFSNFLSFVTVISTGISTGIGDFIAAFIGHLIVYYIILLIVGFIGLFVSGSTIYLVGMLIDDRKSDFDQIIKVLIYSSTPAMLFGWIPVVGGISGFWAIIILALGIRELYRISIARTMVVLFISAINVIAISLVLFMVAAIFIDGNSVVELSVFTAFVVALLALFDGGAYIYCRSRRSQPAERQSLNSSSTFASSSDRQNRPERDDLLFNSISTTSSPMTDTVQRIETRLQKMKAAHPTWMERPEFDSLVKDIQESMTEPSELDDAERLLMQLENRVEQVKQSIDILDRLIDGPDRLRK